MCPRQQSDHSTVIASQVDLFPLAVLALLIAHVITQRRFTQPARKNRFNQGRIVDHQIAQQRDFAIRQHAARQNVLQVPARVTGLPSRLAIVCATEQFVASEPNSCCR